MSLRDIKAGRKVERSPINRSSVRNGILVVIGSDNFFLPIYCPYGTLRSVGRKVERSPINRSSVRNIISVEATVTDKSTSSVRNDILVELSEINSY